MPEEMQAAASAPVEATIRAVKVEAFRPCSAAEMKYASTALTCRGSGSPRQRFMNRSTIVWALSISFCGTAGRPRPRADWATKDRAVTETRARSSRTCSSLMSRKLVETPVRGEHRDRGLHVHPDVAGVHRHRERLGRRQTGAEPAVHQQRPHVAEGDLSDQILDVNASIAQRATRFVGLGNLGLEGDHAFQPRLEVGHFALLDLHRPYTRGSSA